MQDVSRTLNNENPDNPKLFIPSAVISEKGKMVSSGSKAVAALTCIISVVTIIFIAIVICYITTDFGKRLFTIVGVTAVNLFLTQFILRKFVFKEKKLKAKFNEFLTHQVTKIDPFWSILKIKKDGRIVFISGEEAYIICLQRDYLFSRPENFRNIHFNTVTKVYTDLLSKKYNLMYFSEKNDGANEKPMDEIVNKLLTYENKPLIDIVTNIINYNKLLVQKVNTEFEYLIVYTDGSSQQSFSLEQDIKNAVEDYRKTLYEKAYVATRKEVYQVCKNHFNLGALDIVALNSKFSENKNLKVFTIDSVDRTEQIIKDDLDIEMDIDASGADDIFKEFENL